MLQPSDIHPKLADVLPELGHVTPELGHVTPELGHVTPELGHVTPELGHVTPELGHVTPELGHVTPKLGHVTTKLGDPAFDPTEPQTVLLLGRRDPAHGGLQLADQPIQGVEIVAKLDRPVRRRLHGASVGRHPDPADAIGESATGNRPVTEISSAASARRRED